MPLDKIYLTRHAIRLTWTLDVRTGTYHSTYPSPTGIATDPTLTSSGVTQSHELAAHIDSPEFLPKPCRIYSSPFYRCLQTVQPTVEALKKQRQALADDNVVVDLDVRMENGLQDWFGASSSFSHPSPATPQVLYSLFPSILTDPSAEGSKPAYEPQVFPPPKGETIAQLHDRMATTLDAIIAQVDAELEEYERHHPETKNESRAILICAHAAPNIAIGRVLTGNMPEDSSVEDFKPFTAGLTTFERRKLNGNKNWESIYDVNRNGDANTNANTISGRRVPLWKGGNGVRGGWDCVANGDCSFLSGGEQRGWHFNGEEDFDTTPGSSAESNPDVALDSPAKL